MGMGQMIVGLICLAAAAGALVISYFQFKEKGYLFNNVYLWASSAQREQMDENKESKWPHYRQSGFAFLLVGLSFLALAIYSMTDQAWSYIAFWLAMGAALVYAVASSILIERHK